MKKIFPALITVFLFFAIFIGAFSFKASAASVNKCTKHTYSSACDTVCNVCKKTRTSTSKHKFSAATCKKAATCTRCKQVKGKALGHSYSKATCTAPATCTRCKQVKGKALGHSYSKATCTAPATCTRCQKTKGDVLRHSYLSATCTTPATCIKCNVTKGEALGHTYSEATCINPAICTRCKAIKGRSLGHSYGTATCTAPATCIRCDETKGKKLNHKYLSATCTEPKTCKVCGTTEGEALGHNYVFGECNHINNGKLCGHYSESYCPKLYFTGNMDNMTSKKDVRDITFEYRSKDQIVEGAAKIKPQGTSSMAYAKKNFTINFYEDSDYLEKMGVNVGWGAQDEYCLKANWIDKTHSRNVVTAKLVGEMQEKYGLLQTAPNGGAIDGFPVEVFINGQFHGLYTMNIPKDDWQFGMDSDNPNHIVICGENWNDPVKFKAIPQDLNDWGVEVGPEDDATLQKVQRLVDFVLNSSDQEFKANFDQYLNLDATLNYYVMMTYGWMPDNTGKNMLMATYDGKVWYPSLYDLDTTWGAHWTGLSLYNYEKGLQTGGDSVLWQRMESLYKKEIAERYFELREDVLDTKHVMDTFKEFYGSIPQEVLTRETQKWNTTETPIPGYDLSQIQHYLDSVIPRLDAKYNSWK
ncbi:MAG: CotH kinase family protein [Clostridia bacterium]|nr:CotH kinase family protein [Clostridia bacterium]